MRNDKENIIVDMSFKFAIDIVKYTEALEQQKKFVISRQLLKSGTSIGANIREAQNAESKADFIHKLKISAKEVDETQYWLEICNHFEHYPNIDNLLDDLLGITKVLSKIISSSKKTTNTNINYQIN